MERQPTLYFRYWHSHRKQSAESFDRRVRCDSHTLVITVWLSKQAICPGRAWFRKRHSYQCRILRTNILAVAKGNIFTRSDEKSFIRRAYPASHEIDLNLRPSRWDGPARTFVHLILIETEIMSIWIKVTRTCYCSSFSHTYCY